MAVKRKLRTALWTAVGLLFFVILMLPIYWMFASSLMTEQQIFARPPHIIPPTPSLAAYTDQLANEAFRILPSFRNSFLIAGTTMLISVVLSVPCSYALARFRLRLMNLVILVFLMSQMLPQVFLLVPYFIVFKEINVFNTLWAPILANCTTAIPFCVLMLRPYFLNVPKEVDDAALIDGCNHFTSFFRVMLPIARTGVTVAFVFSFLFGYEDMMFSLTFINDYSLWPITTGIYNVVGRYGIRWDRAMAFGCLAVAPVILIFILMQRYIVEGLASGAVKG